MKSTIAAAAIPLVTLLAGCSTYTDFHSEYDNTADFTTYRTVAWLPDGDSLSTGGFSADIVRNNTKNYVNHCLTERGFTVDPTNPDLLLQLVLLNEERQEVVAYPLDLPSYYYYDAYYYPFYYRYPNYYTYNGWGDYNSVSRNSYSASIPTRTYTRGTITLNLIDRQEKRLVWSGSAAGNIYDPSKVHEDVHPAVHKIIASLPVGRLPGK